MKACIQGNGMTYELVPPGKHRRNQAEMGIQTFKSHFISMLAGVDDKFPLSLWCHLLEPTELTLNLLRQFQVTPNVFAFAHVHGNHDYVRKPFAPIADRLRDSHSRETQQPLVMGHTIRARIQPGHIDGTPSLLPSLCHQDESNQDKRHCLF